MRSCLIRVDLCNILLHQFGAERNMIAGGCARSYSLVILILARFYFFLKTTGEIIAGLSAGLLLRVDPRRRKQARFIRHTLALPNEPPPGRTIVSLSTLPGRITRLEPLLRSLLNQTRPPDEIVLAIPKFSQREERPYLIPPSLATFPRLRILPCDRDWGPATKSIPAIQRELAEGRPNTLIMIVDDDRIYPPDALETYVHYHAQLPDAALCFRGGPMPLTFDWRQAKLTRGNRIREPRRVAVVTGCGSYFLQPRFFDQAFWDYSSAPAGAFFMDDIWISGCLDRRGVEKYVVPTSAMMRTVARQLGTLTLHEIPGGRQRSNNETIQYFRSSWNVFDSR